MPMDFPDMNSLRRAAKVHGFREPLPDELEDLYRELLADHVFKTDMIESEEIRNGVGWDKFNPLQNFAMMKRIAGRGKEKKGENDNG